MKPHNSIGRCPRCDRTISTHGNRWARHGITAGSDRYCPMSKQSLIPTGISHRDFERRAAIVTDLACQVRDSDTAIVWEYLTAASAVELQRMMMVALAAIPVDQTLRDTFGWVCELPLAVAS